MSKTFRAVVVGAGGISNAWFPPLEVENVEVAAVVDLRIEAAQGQIDKYGLSAIPATNLLDTLARLQPDFVVDLTIPEAHCATTCAALRAGCHVIGEKPMAASMDEARTMVHAAEETGKLYMVSQSRRWEHLHNQLRQAIESEEIGPVTTLNCDFYTAPHFGGFRDEMPSPLILDMAIHHFDMARYLIAADPVAVYAKEFNPRGSWYKGDTAASCIFEMSDGSIFTYRGSWCAEGCNTSWHGNWRVIGSNGTLLYENDQPVLGEFVAAQSQSFSNHLAPATIPASTLTQTGMHQGLCKMLEFLRTGAVPDTECHDNIKSLAMVFSAIESSKLGQRIAVHTL